MKNSTTGMFAVVAVSLVPRATAPIGALRQGSGVPTTAWPAGSAARLRGTAPVAHTEPDSAWRTLLV